MTNVTLESGLTAFTENFVGLQIFGESWIFAAVVTLLLIVLITRNTKMWGILFLPMTFVVGAVLKLQVDFIQYTIASIVFVITAMSNEQVQNALRAMTGFEGKLKKSVGSQLATERLKKTLINMQAGIGLKDAGRIEDNPKYIQLKQKLEEEMRKAKFAERLEKLGFRRNNK